jgi:hypothetical protein
LEGVEFKDDSLQITPVKATATPEARAFADGIEAMMPRVRITEVLHDVKGQQDSPLPLPTCAPAKTARIKTRYSPQFWPMLPILVSAAWPLPVMA